MVGTAREGVLEAPRGELVEIWGQPYRKAVTHRQGLKG